MSNMSKADRNKMAIFKDTSPLSDGQNKMLNIFFGTVLGTTVAAMVGIIVFYAYSLACMYHDTASGASIWLLGIFSDFVEIMNFSLDDSPYLEGVGSSYPPIAIAVLFPFAMICKSVFAQYSGMDQLDIDELTSLVVRHPQFWVALILFFLISTVSIILLAVRICKLDLESSLKLAVLIPFSAPFVYAIMRGNTIYFALIFILLFLLFYRSKYAILRELAYVCLAISGCIKIYPLFFGVFLLKDKKIFASIRVAIYFFALFFLSFKLFPGSEGDTTPFLENLQGFMSDTERLSSLRNLSITALIYKIVALFSVPATQTQAFSIVNIIILIMVFVFATVTAVATRSNLSRAVICSAIVILIPPITYYYVLIFELIPFMEYLKNYDTLSKRKRTVYGIMFMIIMFTPLLLPQFYIPHSLIVMFMLGFEGYRVIKNEIIPWFKRLKSKKASIS